MPGVAVLTASDGAVAGAAAISGVFGASCATGDAAAATVVTATECAGGVAAAAAGGGAGGGTGSVAVGGSVGALPPVAGDRLFALVLPASASRVGGTDAYVWLGGAATGAACGAAAAVATAAAGAVVGGAVVRVLLPAIVAGGFAVVAAGLGSWLGAAADALFAAGFGAAALAVAGGVAAAFGAGLAAALYAVLAPCPVGSTRCGRAVVHPPRITAAIRQVRERADRGGGSGLILGMPQPSEACRDGQSDKH